jgi:two-component system sensor histidine kinase HydH
MSYAVFGEMKRYVGFTEEDAAHLRDVGPRMEPVFPSVVDAFYDRIRQDSGAKAVLTDDPERIQRLRGTFSAWLRELFSGQYDEAYFERRSAIGRTHVEVRLPQHYMFTAMSVTRTLLLVHMHSLRLKDLAAKALALNRLLDLDLAIMLDSYREDLIAQLRQVEQDRYEQRLSEAKHLATVGQLAASLAHEIKNPLAGISGALQIIGARLPSDHPHKEVLIEAQAQIERLDAAVRDLLVFARPTAPRRSPQSLPALVQRSVMLLQQEPAIRRLEVVMETPEDDLTASVDEMQMQQLLSNLFINAADACGPTGRVVCRLRDEGKTVAIEVEDNGTGMTPDVASRAFEPFYTTKARGTGLGLAICRRIVEGHEGEMRIETGMGRGTRVVIRLGKSG